MSVVSAGVSMSASAVRIRVRAIGTAAVECGSAIRQEAGIGPSGGKMGFRSGGTAVRSTSFWSSRLLPFNLTKRNDTDKGLGSGPKGTFTTFRSAPIACS